jgi:hypothetical protein
VLMLTGHATAKKMYKVAKNLTAMSYLTETPCGVCPVKDLCREGGLISPVSCEYFNHWLARQAEQGDDLLASSSYVAW